MAQLSLLPDNYAIKPGEQVSTRPSVTYAVAQAPQRPRAARAQSAPQAHRKAEHDRDAERFTAVDDIGLPRPATPVKPVLPAQPAAKASASAPLRPASTAPRATQKPAAPPRDCLSFSLSGNFLGKPFALGHSNESGKNAKGSSSLFVTGLVLNGALRAFFAGLNSHAWPFAVTSTLVGAAFKVVGGSLACVTGSICGLLVAAGVKKTVAKHVGVASAVGDVAAYATTCLLLVAYMAATLPLVCVATAVSLPFSLAAAPFVKAHNARAAKLSRSAQGETNLATA